MASSDDMVRDVGILRRAVMEDNWSIVLKMFKEKRELRTAKINATGDTVLHIAVFRNKEDVVESMVEIVLGEKNDEEDDENGDDDEHNKLALGAKNEKDNTPLHLAACRGSVKMCMKIGGADCSLIASRNIAGETPLFLAAFYGNKEAFLWLHYLYIPRVVSSTEISYCIRNNGDTILHCAITEHHLDVAIEIVYLYKDGMKEMMRRNKEGLSPLHILAAKPHYFESDGVLHRLPIIGLLFYWFLRVKQKNRATTLEELQKQNQTKNSVKRLRLLPLKILRSPAFMKLRRTFHYIFKIKEAQRLSGPIMNQLLEHASDEDIMSKIISRTASEHLSILLQTQEDNVLESGTVTIETPLMIAVKNGVVEMVDSILELFPSRIKDVNCEGKNILLLAVEYGQTEVYQYLCRHKWTVESLFEQVDKEGNNALHLAATLKVGWVDFGEANGWYEFVINTMPQNLLGRYNKKMETPEDIFFRESHDKLIEREAELATKTSEACSVVSTLVASVAFATRSSVPGGYDQYGYAIFRNYPPVFRYFVECEKWALCFSIISTICFLSILASANQSVYTASFVALKLYVGMFFMFSSIVLLWISFCAGHFFTLDDETRYFNSAFQPYIFPSLLIILLAATQFPTFIRPVLYSFPSIPAPRRKVTPPIEYRRANNNENAAGI